MSRHPSPRLSVFVGAGGVAPDGVWFLSVARRCREGGVHTDVQENSDVNLMVYSGTSNTRVS